ncbi:hypothetical protein CR513_05953, partial [Mucuna pruriens]
MHQLDVKFAFLNSPLEEEVYMLQPQGFVVKGEENKAPRAWNRRIDSSLSQIGFKKCTSKHGVHKEDMKSEKLIVCLYVDDLLITGNNEKAIVDFK